MVIKSFLGLWSLLCCQKLMWKAYWRSPPVSLALLLWACSGRTVSQIITLLLSDSVVYVPFTFSQFQCGKARYAATHNMQGVLQSNSRNSKMISDAFGMNTEFLKHLSCDKSSANGENCLCYWMKRNTLGSKDTLRRSVAGQEEGSRVCLFSARQHRMCGLEVAKELQRASDWQRKPFFSNRWFLSILIRE